MLGENVSYNFWSPPRMGRDFIYTNERRRNAASLQSRVAQSDRIAAHHPSHSHDPPTEFWAAFPLT